MLRRKVDPKSRRFHRQSRTKPPYRVIAVGVYDDQAVSLDRAAEHLQRAGLKANRSFVVQALVRRLQQEIEGLSSDAVVDLFIARYSRRPLAPVARRTEDAIKRPPRARRGIASATGGVGQTPSGRGRAEA